MTNTKDVYSRAVGIFKDGGLHKEYRLGHCVRRKLNAVDSGPQRKSSDETGTLDYCVAWVYREDREDMIDLDWTLISRELGKQNLTGFVVSSDQDDECHMCIIEKEFSDEIMNISYKSYLKASPQTENELSMVLYSVEDPLIVCYWQMLGNMKYDIASILDAKRFESKMEERIERMKLSIEMPHIMSAFAHQKSDEMKIGEYSELFISTEDLSSLGKFAHLLRCEFSQGAQENKIVYDVDSVAPYIITDEGRVEFVSDESKHKWDVIGLIYDFDQEV